MSNGFDTPREAGQTITWTALSTQDRDDVQREFDPASGRHVLQGRFKLAIEKERMEDPGHGSRACPPRRTARTLCWRKSADMFRLKLLRVALAASGREATVARGCLPDPTAARAGGSRDFDNFLTGICDGLMAAHGNSPARHDVPGWADVPEAAPPDRDIV